MSFPKFITILGTRFAWRDILAIRRAQHRTQRQSQPVLFELKDDTRPITERDAQTRYQEPTLFTLMPSRRGK